jgi:hypothetical protein
MYLSSQRPMLVFSERLGNLSELRVIIFNCLPQLMVLRWGQMNISTDDN